MKVVSAKCPNCGANIEVDENSNQTKCEFCKSNIIVEDAIKKYKVELSGSIEVANIPKFDNYIKLADRNYRQEKYEIAVEYYTKALEINPDSPKAIIMTEFSKMLEDKSKINENSIISCIQEASKFEKINKYAETITDFLKKLLILDVQEYFSITLNVIKFFYKDLQKINNLKYVIEAIVSLEYWTKLAQDTDTRLMEKEEVEKFQERLSQCKNFYGDLLAIVPDEETEIIKRIYNNQITLNNELLKKKIYKKINPYGQILYFTLFLPNDYIKAIKQENEEIFDRILSIDPALAKKVEEEKKAQSERKDKNFYIATIIIFSILLLLGLATTNIVVILCVMLPFLLELPYIKEKWFDNNVVFHKITIIASIIFSSIVVCIYFIVNIFLGIR